MLPDIDCGDITPFEWTFIGGSGSERWPTWVESGAVVVGGLSGLFGDLGAADALSSTRVVRGDCRVWWCRVALGE